MPFFLALPTLTCCTLKLWPCHFNQYVALIDCLAYLYAPATPPPQLPLDYTQTPQTLWHVPGLGNYIFCARLLSSFSYFWLPPDCKVILIMTFALPVYSFHQFFCSCRICCCFEIPIKFIRIHGLNTYTPWIAASLHAVSCPSGRHVCT